MHEGAAKKFVIPSRDDDLLEENDDFYTIAIRPELDEIISKVFRCCYECAENSSVPLVNLFLPHSSPIEERDHIDDAYNVVSSKDRNFGIVCYRAAHPFIDFNAFSEGEPWRLRAQLVSVLNSGLKQTLDSVEELLPMLTSEAEAEIAQDLNTEREMHVRALLMYIYLLCRLAVLFEKECANR
ncbi:unnamed protein product [Gongylonema pulchrum]|uniref:Cnd1_N domain-containing protein n=1 Tax=Gongylonema pulchrum TaxID=637853 RepID=A0A183EA29_9BILA|nr:unnamed protein product [Gongylonema pulchrum]